TCCSSLSTVFRIGVRARSAIVVPPPVARQKLVFCESSLCTDVARVGFVSRTFLLYHFTWSCDQCG
ncbi:unnamed protein product, partial [Callosobruchus maculatus]